MWSCSIMEVSNSIHERSVDALLRATLQKAHVAVTRNDGLYRNRRRPAQEYSGDEYSSDRLSKMLGSGEQSFSKFAWLTNSHCYFSTNKRIFVMLSAFYTFEFIESGVIKAFWKVLFINKRLVKKTCLYSPPTLHNRSQKRTLTRFFCVITTC